LTRSSTWTPISTAAAGAVLAMPLLRTAVELFAALPESDLPAAESAGVGKRRRVA
jgi:hypothetical protein